MYIYISYIYVYIYIYIYIYILTYIYIYTTHIYHEFQAKIYSTIKISKLPLPKMDHLPNKYIPSSF